MEKLGRYYTKEIFSRLLIDKITTDNPQNIVELGVGGGALVKAAINRWVNASYYVADVDKRSLSKIKSELPNIKSFHFDTITENVPERLNIKNGTFDIAVCNPPYLKLENGDLFHQIFEEANLNECKKLKKVTTEIIFLAKNLLLLKNSGELGIILPDSLITGVEFRNLRSALINNHNLKGIIQLPEKIFSKTEALTHILLLEKGGPGNQPIPILLSDSCGNIIDQTDVCKDSLIDRMDFKFHSWNKKSTTSKKNLTLGSINAEVRRGRSTHKELKQLRCAYIHTTNLVHLKSNLCLPNVKLQNRKLCMTRSGDILLARVGSVGKISMVRKGQTPVSDCIYIIRVSEFYRIKVWDSLSSSAGQERLNAISHGVCAKLISKEELLNFPID